MGSLLVNIVLLIFFPFYKKVYEAADQDGNCYVLYLNFY